MSGGLKRAQRALGCPLDWQVRRSRLDGQGRPAGTHLLEATPARTPVGGRAVCQSVPVLHHQKATLQQRAHVSPLASAAEGAPLVGQALPETTDTLNSDSTRRLTFDMSGGFGLAQPAQRRPLDGGVRAHARYDLHFPVATACAHTGMANSPPS